VNLPATPPPSQSSDASAAAASDGAAPSQDASGFRARGRVRRRARFLRKARELAYRDLGGLVFNLHRFGQRNDTLVLAKLDTLAKIDSELRTLESALGERRPLTVLREAGVTACPRCATIHSGEDRFCPGCGLPLSRRVDLPIAGAASTPVPDQVLASTGAAAAAAGSPAPTSAAPTPASKPASTAGAPAREPQPAAGSGRVSPPGSPRSDTAATPVPAVSGRGSDGPAAEPALEPPTKVVPPRGTGQ
jgi:hypothetical protein